MLRRPRRNRYSAAIRGLAQETHLSPEHLVQPLFLVDGKGIREEISSLPGSFRLSTDETLREIEACMELGVKSFIAFPKVADKLKDKRATHSYSNDNFYLQAAREIKARFPEACLISDVAMDPYSSDGHDGFVYNGEVINDETLHILQKMAL
ncbi:MAG: porphobilinogen synthase, partial [Phaeodactylibacter sp.]|nr:porphobilinogen synthase [Phaeodactylibacter sp.]